jgi:hypothetical protein
MVALRISPYNGLMRPFVSAVFLVLPLLLPAQESQPPRAGNLPQGEPQGLDAAPEGPPFPDGQPASQLTAVGDVHGDFKTFRALLRSVGLIDLQDRWRGGTRHLVQTGDLLDRGGESRQALELLMSLEEEARAAGGQVVVVLGNHEVMNMTGDFAYTSREEFLAFQNDERPEDRAARRKEILRLVREGSPLVRSSYFEELSRVLDEPRFDRFFPPGYFAHQDAFSPDGRYGKWLLEHPAIHRENGALFLHGGLSPRYGDWTLGQINKAIKRTLLEYLEAISALEKLGVFHRALGANELWLFVRAERRKGETDPRLDSALKKIEAIWDTILFDADGPLWYRGLALESEWRLERFVSRTLSTHGVTRIVLGHTQPKGLAIEARFQGQVILIDTGMNQAVYGGCPSALLMSPDGGVRAWETGSKK